MAQARRLPFATAAETWSTISSTPRPPVASSTRSGQAGSPVSTATSQPNSPSRARRSALVELPSTSFAPIDLAICMPMRPTPEDAPWISTLSPATRRPFVTTASCMVCNAMGKVAACSQPMLLSGTGDTRPQSATAYSA